MRELTALDALSLLGSVSLGRIAFTRHALPMVRPVHHLLDGWDVIVRGGKGAPVMTAAGQVVAYEADRIDSFCQFGWSVVATGIARAVEDPADTARYERLLLPWLRHAMNYFVRITPEIVTGFELVASPDVDEEARADRSAS